MTESRQESTLGRSEKAELVFRRMRGDIQCALCSAFVGRRSWNRKNPHPLYGVLCKNCRHELMPCPGCGALVMRKKLMWPALPADIVDDVVDRQLADCIWVCGFCKHHSVKYAKILLVPGQPSVVVGVFSRRAPK